MAEPYEVQVMVRNKRTRKVNTKIVTVRADTEDDAKVRVRAKYMSRGNLYDIGFARKKEATLSLRTILAEEGLLKTAQAKLFPEVCFDLVKRKFGSKATYSGGNTPTIRISTGYNINPLFRMELYFTIHFARQFNWRGDSGFGYSVVYFGVVTPSEGYPFDPGPEDDVVDSIATHWIFNANAHSPGGIPLYSDGEYRDFMRETENRYRKLVVGLSRVA